jgi:putative CocE/NonD family hydrolase
MGLIDSHPALKAVSPQAPVADWFSTDDWHHNGAFLLAHAFGWFSRAGWEFTQPTTAFPGPPQDPHTFDGYEFYLRLGPLRNANERYMHNQISFWNAMMEHDSKDAFWSSRNILPHLKHIKPAVMTVGGWYDAENLYGALEVYKSIETSSPGIFNILVMGPWVHGGWSSTDGASLGDVRFDAKTSEFYGENIELSFFNHFLKNKGEQSLPKAYVFETGTNVWHRMDAWPPKQLATKNLHLGTGGRLSFDAPRENADSGFDEYVSDPKKPVPLMTGVAPGMARSYMTEDQRSAGRRPDVLVYTSDLLEESLTLAGPIRPSLFVSTTGTDSDWIVKLIDVYPDLYPKPSDPGELDEKLGGYWQLVRGDILRGKFRNSLEKPEAFTPGKPAKVEFVEGDIFHTFRRGHRIMVQIQSTWFPFADLNPGKFINIYQATEADFQKTTQRVYHSSSMPSAVRVGVLSKAP